jgi:hypothetical protein
VYNAGACMHSAWGAIVELRRLDVVIRSTVDDNGKVTHDK